jgi:hypothetical protein
MDLNKKVDLTFEQLVFLGELVNANLIPSNKLNENNLRIAKSLIDLECAEMVQETYLATPTGMFNYEKAQDCYSYRR